MPNDELAYHEIVEIACQDAERRGVAVESVEKDETLFVTIRRAKSSDHDQQVEGSFDVASDEVGIRSEVRFWTYGTGAFIVDFDNRWSWHEFAYDRVDQIDAVHDIMNVADNYLRGAGEEQTTRVRLGSKKEVMVVTVDGERIVLNAKPRRSR
jgi:hypothetical protein